MSHAGGVSSRINNLVPGAWRRLALGLRASVRSPGIALARRSQQARARWSLWIAILRAETSYHRQRRRGTISPPSMPAVATHVRERADPRREYRRRSQRRDKLTGPEAPKRLNRRAHHARARWLDLPGTRTDLSSEISDQIKLRNAAECEGQDCGQWRKRGELRAGPESCVVARRSRREPLSIRPAARFTRTFARA